MRLDPCGLDLGAPVPGYRTCFGHQCAMNRISECRRGSFVDLLRWLRLTADQSPEGANTDNNGAHSVASKHAGLATPAMPAMSFTGGTRIPLIASRLCLLFYVVGPVSCQWLLSIHHSPRLGSIPYSGGCPASLRLARSFSYVLRCLLPSSLSTSGLDGPRRRSGGGLLHVLVHSL